ncbi:Uncharacterized protein SCF082_LOCUS50639 [Durusdinium trenchii]|uniref:PH domain-containing protein n=1 Tax=Durusdinium trenchii TaxID=1381693 RepID=A0ABP0S9A7_9DINO
MEGSPLEKLDEWLMRGHPLQDARLAVTESPEVKAERQDWEQAEIASLLKEAQTLRSQKERLEEQIAEAQDVNASLQSSWGALSRASTGLASSPMKDDKSWDGRDEVLSASQQSLELDLQQLQHRLRQAEVVVSRCNEEAASLERQKDQAKELAELLQEFQALQLRLDEGNRQLSSLRQSQESTEQEGGALQAQLQALNEAMPKAARQQRELSLEAQKAKHELNEAQDQWQAQVRIRQSSLQVDEQQLMKQLARQESSNLKALEGRSARSDLSSKVAHLRLEYGRLLSWQQAHRMGQSDLDLFGLRASAETLRKQVESRQPIRAMAFKEGWLLKRGARLHELGEVALGPGSRASRFSSLRAPGDSAKYRKEKPWGFALEVNLAAKHRPVEYFEAEDAKSLGDWLSAIEGWVEDSMWHPGDIVLVREDFVSDSEQQMPLKMGSFGMVVEVDADGDTKVDFPCHDARQWVFERNQHKLHLEKDLEPKEVFLEIVPQNDVIMHWALRVGRGRISRCYEFEADGVSQSWHTFLDKGYEITKQKLGTTSRLHREIFAWCRTFGLENSYDAAGNGLLGGKNCQDCGRGN